MVSSQCFTVQEIPGAGRGLVAVRDISKGQMILESLPASLGPQADTFLEDDESPQYQCLQCWKLLKNRYNCPRCRLPVCDFICSTGDLHKIECDVFLNIRIKLQATVGNGIFRQWIENEQDIISSVSIIRLLSLKWRDPETWNMLSQMAVDKIHEPLMKSVESTHSKFLYIDERLQESDLRHLVGIQSTNGASLHFPPGHGKGVGVYPIQAFLNHDCNSNTETLEHPLSHQVQVYAKRDIVAGDQVTTSYVQVTQPTWLRRTKLFSSWNFHCACSKCSDPTELGTFCSALACCARCPGMILPLNPLDNEGDWKCRNCHLKMNADIAQKAYNKAYKKVTGINKNDASLEDLEKTMFELSTLVSCTNNLWIEAEQKLLVKYMKIPDKSLSRPAIDRKIQIIINVLKYMERCSDTEDIKNSNRYKMLQICLLSAKSRRKAN